MADEIVTTDSHRDTLDLTQRQSLLSNHPFFMRLNPSDLVELVRNMNEIQYEPGDPIVKEGDLVDAIYVIAEGTAEVSKRETSKYGVKKIFIATLTHGEIIGLSEKGFFAPEGARTADVTAVSKMVALRLRVTDLSQFLRAHPQFTSDTQHAAENLLRMNFIKQVIPFAHLTIGRIRWLSQHIEKLTIPAKVVLFEEGDIGDACFLIYSGEVEIYTTQADGTESIIATLKAPSMFGEAALLTHSPRNASARTLSECTLFSITRKDLLALTGRATEANQAITALMTERARPLKFNNIEESHKTTSDGQLIVTLKHPRKNEYFRLTESTYLLWKRIDGKHSIHSIVSEITQRYPNTNPELVYSTLYNLGNAGFIDLATLRLNKHTDVWSLWSNANPLTWIVSLVGILLIVFSAVYFWMNYNPSGRVPQGFIVSAPLVKFVMVVDISDTPSPTQDDVLSGQLPILTMHEGINPNGHNNDVFNVIDEIKQLALLDTDNNGRIDNTDTSFAFLELVFLAQDGSISKHIPLAQAGIRAILLNKPAISNLAAKNDISQSLGNVISQIVMADGSTHPIQIMPIDQRYLPY